MTPRIIRFIIGLMLVTVPAIAETGYMIVQVQDVHRRPSTALRSESKAKAEAASLATTGKLSSR